MILILKIWILSRFLVTVPQNPRPEEVVVVGNFRSDLKQIISFKRGGCWRNFHEAFFSPLSHLSCWFRCTSVLDEPTRWY